MPPPYPEPAQLLPRHQVLPEGAVLKVFLRSATLGQDEVLARARGVVDPAQAGAYVSIHMDVGRPGAAPLLLA